MKKIKNLSKYGICEDGRIWSYHLGGYMKQQVKYGRSKKGYYCVSVIFDDGSKKKKTTHSLVCEAYHGERPTGYECDHIDGDPHNNHASNLEWVTPEENIRRMGILSRKYFSVSDCNRMDELYENYPVRYIAERFNVSSSIIKRSLVERGIFDGRINRISDYNGKISELDKIKIADLHKTGRYSFRDIQDIMGIDTNIGYCLKDFKDRAYYRDINIPIDYSEGLGLDEIVSKYSTSVSMVKKLIRNNGIDFRSEDVYDKSAEYIIKDLDKFSGLVDEGYTISKLKKEFNCGGKAINTALKRIGKRTKGLERKYDYKELYEMNKTMPQWKIAEKLGTSQSNIAIKISKYKKENGIGGHGNKTKKPE